VSTRTNNVAEYLSLIYGLNSAVKLGIKRIQVFSDSDLAVKQVKGVWKVNEENLARMRDEVRCLSQEFSHFALEWITRDKNNVADSLAKIAITRGLESITAVNPRVKDGKTNVDQDKTKENVEKLGTLNKSLRDETQTQMKNYYHVSKRKTEADNGGMVIEELTQNSKNLGGKETGTGTRSLKVESSTDTKKENVDTQFVEERR